MKKNTTMAFIAMLMILLTGLDASAITKISSQSGNWSAPATWGGSVPLAGDDVIINGGFTVTVDVPTAACLSLQLGGSVINTGTGTISFLSGSVLTVSGIVNLGPVNSNSVAGSLTMLNGGTLICEGILVGRLGTWTAGTGTIQLSATNTIPSNNNVIFFNLVMSGGTTSLPRNVDVNGELHINTGATLDGGANTLTVGGNWTNNGTFTGNTGTVLFIKNGNATISGNGLNNFNLLRVNMGVGINNTLEVVSSHFNAPDPFLTIVNGTFKISGSFTFANSFITGPLYNIDPGTGFWLNNPNVTVTGQAGGGVSVRGLLRISAGTFNVGTGIDNAMTYMTGSSITIEGGTLSIAGRLSRNNATQTTAYSQSGGTVTVVGQGSTDPTFAGFDLGTVGCTFTMSGGTIIVRNATSAPSDFLNIASTANVTGGTLQIGDATTGNAQTVRIQSARPVGNILVSGATSQPVKPVVQLVSSGLNVIGTVTVQPGTSLNAGGLNITLGGDWVDNGSFTNGNAVTFNGTSGQAISNPAGETFSNLTVNKPGSTLTLNNAVTVNNAFAFDQGTMAVVANTLNLNGSVTGAGSFIGGGPGTVNYNLGSAGQNVLPGNYGNLIFSNFNKTLPSTGVIGIAGTFTPGSGAGHTVTGSTVDFNGGSQPVPPFAYNNLVLSGTGTKTGSGTLTTAGNLTVNPGVIFTGATNLNLNGPINMNAGTISAGSLTMGPGAAITNNGSVTTLTALGGPGTFTQGASGMLIIGGTSAIASLNASASGNLTNYNGVSQTVVPAVYHHLTLSGSGSTMLTGVSAINGDLTISGSISATSTTDMTIGENMILSPGATFDVGATTESVKGNWSNNGTFVPGAGTIILNGTSPQTISGSPFNNLTIVNASGTILLSDETVNGALTLTTGALTIGAHTLTLNGTLSPLGGILLGGGTSNLTIGGTGAGITVPGLLLNNFTLNRSGGAIVAGDITVNNNLSVINGLLVTNSSQVILGPTGTLSEVAGQPILGNVRTTRNIIATSGTESFGNIGSDLVLNGVAPGFTTAVRKTGTASSGNGHTSILRYFDITPVVNTGLNADLVFHYDPAELNGQNAAALELYRSHDNSISWNNLGGAVNTVSGTLTINGINDLSRWTAADPANNLGNTATPVTTGIIPASKTVGDPAFVLTVRGNEFVNGKSTVRFNSADRATTYVNSTHLTALIPSTDLLAIGSYPVTVFTSGGGGVSNPQTLNINPGPPVKIRIETAANGTGTVVPAQSLSSGSPVTVYAIARDAFNNFTGNIAASWILENITGGVVAGDLVPAIDSKSAVFTGHVTGSADIRATSGILTATPSGLITVTPGPAVSIKVETAANGSGAVIAAQSIPSGSSLTGFAIARDASNNFTGNIAGSWVLENITGGVVAGDLVPAVDSKSAVFTGHVTGSADIRATSGILTATPSGLITVTMNITLNVQNEGILSGQSPCYNATQTITVAGNGNTFFVENGGSATMIAGQNIIYLPGTTVFPGGYLHGYITTTNQYCIPVPAVKQAITSDSPEPDPAANHPFLRVFPNPTSGVFTLDIKGDESFSGTVSIEIFDMRGSKVVETEMSGNGQLEMSLAGKPAGIYVIHAYSGSRTETSKIIRQ